MNITIKHSGGIPKLNIESFVESFLQLTMLVNNVELDSNELKMLTFLLSHTEEKFWCRKSHSQAVKDFMGAGTQIYSNTKRSLEEKGYLIKHEHKKSWSYLNEGTYKIGLYLNKVFHSNEEVNFVIRVHPEGVGKLETHD